MVAYRCRFGIAGFFNIVYGTIQRRKRKFFSGMPRVSGIEPIEWNALPDSLHLENETWRRIAQQLSQKTVRETLFTRRQMELRRKIEQSIGIVTVNRSSRRRKVLGVGNDINHMVVIADKFRSIQQTMGAVGLSQTLLKCTITEPFFQMMSGGKCGQAIARIKYGNL